ncbi:tyrosine-type recombinase/integrase [Patescibacteria group bacterium]
MTYRSKQQSGTSLWTHWDEFVMKYLRTGRSNVTVKNVRDALKFITSNCGITTIEHCNNQRLLEDALFEMKKERHWSNVTYNAYLKNLNTYFMWLEKQGYITENNLKKVSRCKEELNEQYTLSEDQVKLVVAQIHDRRQTRLQRYRNVFFIDLLRFTGARPCELLNIQCKHIREEKDTYVLAIQGRKQKGRIRYYRFPSWLRDSYETYMDYRARLRENEPYVFISSSKQGKWTEKGMRGLFRKLSNELEFRITAYSFRRFVATHLNKEGVDLKDIQQYLGHTRPSTTLRYIERSCVLTDKCGLTMSKIIES